MNQRKATILKYVVTDYVNTCTPVGSIKVAEKLGVSPATVRNDMRALLDEGYLEQPHTSAGRIPSDFGYRFFVDYLIEEYSIAEEERQSVQKSLELIRFRLEQLLKEISVVLSTWSDCMSFIAVPEENRSTIRHIELTQVSARDVLIIMVLSNGLVENKLVEISAPADRLPIKQLTRALNERLGGLRISSITPAFLSGIFRDFRIQEEILYRSLLQFFEEMIFSFGNSFIYSGSNLLIKHPEFQTSDKLAPVLEAVEKSASQLELFDLGSDRNELDVAIGHEIPNESLHECSLIKCNFSFGDETNGTIGLIGPKRMNYSKVIGLVRKVSNLLTEVLASHSRI
ncbi:MAG TPA: heat-inducible transcriptional repressor HrcA [bacterium]|nr:heat-inducible transcriptional repressor HrcA [bacterium]